MQSRSELRISVLLALAGVILIGSGLTGCGGADSNPTEKASTSATEPTASLTRAAQPVAPSPSASQVDAAIAGSDRDELAPSPESPERPQRDLHPRVRITTTLGELVVELDAAKAPETVDNFLNNYVARQYYDQTPFHHVEKGFMAAAGGFTADLQSKETRAAIRNESSNGLKNVRGTLAMSRHPDFPDSATSQFFFNLADNPALDFVASEGTDGEDQAGYCVFGKVVEGLEVLDRIAQVPVHESGSFPMMPTEPVLIEKIERVE